MWDDFAVGAGFAGMAVAGLSALAMGIFLLWQAPMYLLPLFVVILGGVFNVIRKRLPPIDPGKGRS